MDGQIDSFAFDYEAVLWSRKYSTASYRDDDCVAGSINDSVSRWTDLTSFPVARVQGTAHTATLHEIRRLAVWTSKLLGVDSSGTGSEQCRQDQVSNPHVRIRLR